MNDDFNIETNYEKISSYSNKKKLRIGKSILLPFVSGIIGASTVIATCIYVPSINSKLFQGSNQNSSTTLTSSTNVATPASAINLTEYSETSIAVANKVLPSIVGIKVQYNVSYNMGGFFGSNTKQSSTAESQGSGIIISEDGYIVTNNHVIDSSSTSSNSFYSISEANKIIVNLHDDPTDYEATIVGTDSLTDLAVIKIDKNDLTPAELGDSDSVLVGEFVMALGNPLGMQSSVTSGIVSAVNREVESSDGQTYTAIQTDTAINSGNSGGALVNSKGEVIGINTLKLSGESIEGMGFAIPISSAKNIIDQLIEFKTVKRPYIGISGIDIDEQASKYYNIPIGVYIQSIEENSPAQSAGLKIGDVITKINDTSVSTVDALNKVKNNCNIGDTVTLTIMRGGEEKQISLTLAEST